MKRVFSILLVLVILPAAGRARAEGTGIPGINELLARINDTLKNTSDYSGVMIKKERLGRKIKTEITEFKFARDQRVYLKFIKPHRGREVIFAGSRYKNKLKVHNGSFPDINLTLDPLGSMAMKGNHHPITHFGFDHLMKKVSQNLDQARERKEGTFRVTDGGVIRGRPVFKLEARFPEKFYSVRAGAEETLWDVARRTGQDMYVILQANSEYDDPERSVCNPVFVRSRRI
jgi:hypothetical protein